MIGWLYEKVTGTPWTTSSPRVSELYGPPPGAVFANELGGMPDALVLARHDEFMAAYRERNAWAVAPDGVAVSA